MYFLLFNVLPDADAQGLGCPTKPDLWDLQVTNHRQLFMKEPHRIDALAADCGNVIDVAVQKGFPKCYVPTKEALAKAE